MEIHEQIIEALETGQNLLITGGAGVGKSYNLRKVIEWADDNNKEVARTALTGMASLQFECGETVHRCFGIGNKTNKEKHLSSIVTSFKFTKETRFELEVCDLFIIDEVSMLRADVLELLDAILKYVTRKDEPFGGKQVILSGDFMQLPPIVKPEERKELPNPWCFQSPVFLDLNFKIIYLTEIKRQDDQKFCLALNMVRAGAINDAVDEYFFNTHRHKFPEGVEPVNLLSTNNEVNRVNEKRLEQINEPLEKYQATINFKPGHERERDKLVRDCPAMESLELKVGAQVMVLVNDKHYAYVNGSMGTYLGMTEMTIGEGLFEETVQAVIVKLFDTGTRASIPVNVWRVEKKDGDKIQVLASFKQLPVKLGWAITVHKSQGMSLDYLQVDLTRCFAEGMAYVALSRARKYEGLRIVNWRPGAIRCNKDAFNFYMGLKNKGVI
jgi:ATP-dependent exoDNAse (exonuclease V) alpha subunit